MGSVRDLVEETKKQILLLGMCVIGLSYLMSLRSSPVLLNLHAAASLIFILRYISLDLEMRRRAAAYNNKVATSNHVLKKSQEGPKVVSLDKFSWRKKVNSPVVEVAIDHFTRHLVSEWVTDLWYSRLTPDKDGPEAVVYVVVEEHALDAKVIIFKKNRRKNYRRTKGHLQEWVLFMSA